MVHYLLKSNFMMRKRSQANHYGRISGRSDTSSRRASGRSFRGVQKGFVIIRGDSSMPVTASEDPAVRLEVEVKDSFTDDPDSV